MTHRLARPRRAAAGLARRAASSGTPTTLDALLLAAAEPPARAAAALDAELDVRLASQVRLLRPLAASAPARAARPAEILHRLHAGLLAQLRAAAPLLEGGGGGDARASPARLERWHRELRGVEHRHAAVMEALVDVLRVDAGAAEGGGAWAAALPDALTDALRSHIGVALLVRHHLLAHAPHLDNPGTRSRGPGAASRAGGDAAAAAPPAMSGCVARRLRLRGPLQEAADEAAQVRERARAERS